jgi:hypothetical protein
MLNTLTTDSAGAPDALSVSDFFRMTIGEQSVWLLRHHRLSIGETRFCAKVLARTVPLTDEQRQTLFGIARRYLRRDR